MTVREYLSLVEDKEDAIVETKEYIDRLRGSLGIAGIDYSKDRIQSGGGSDRFAEVFSKIFKAEEKLKRMEEEFVMFRVQVIEMIQKVPEKKHRDVLTYLYLDYMSLKTCADKMGFCYDYTRELHRDALAAFEEKFPHQFC